MPCINFGGLVDLGLGGGQMLWVVKREIQRGRERHIWRGRKRKERQMGERRQSWDILFLLRYLYYFNVLYVKIKVGMLDEL